MNFGEALTELKNGNRVARAGWNGKGMWLRLVPKNAWLLRERLNLDVPTALQGNLPWIGMKTADDMFVPWLASQTDILAEDWSIAE